MQRSPRWNSRFLVDATGPAASFSATMVNISAEGGGLVGIPVDQLKPGDRLVLFAAGIRLGAQLRWVRFDTCGLLFDRSLSERELDLARRTGMRRAGQR